MTENFVTREELRYAERITALEQNVVSIKDAQKAYQRISFTILGVFAAIAISLFVLTQNDIDSIRADIADIKVDVATLKTDVAALQDDVTALQVGQQQIFAALRNEGIIQ